MIRIFKIAGVLELCCCQNTASLELMSVHFRLVMLLECRKQREFKVVLAHQVDTLSVVLIRGHLVSLYCMLPVSLLLSTPPFFINN